MAGLEERIGLSDKVTSAMSAKIDELQERIRAKRASGTPLRWNDTHAEIYPYSGEAAYCSVDLFHSTGLTAILDAEYGLNNVFVTAMLETLQQMVVEEHGGYWDKTKGDEVLFIIPEDLPAGIDAVRHVMMWADRELSPYVKDYAVASTMVREQLNGDLEHDKPIIEGKIRSLREIKDLWGNDVPVDRRAEKATYEQECAKIDRLLERYCDEEMGRVPTRGAIAFGHMQFKVDIEINAKHERLLPKIREDPAGKVRYLFQFLGESGITSGKKDVIYVATWDRLETLPAHTWEFAGMYMPRVVPGEVDPNRPKKEFAVAKTIGINPYRHPTFNGILPAGSPLIRRLNDYRREVDATQQFLAEVEREYKTHRSFARLDVTAIEIRDRYKVGRSQMVATLVTGMIDEIVDHIYPEYLASVRDASSAMHSEKQPYLQAFFKDETLTEFVDYLKANRKTLLLTALLYSIGGTRARADGTPPYPGRMLSTYNNPWRTLSEQRRAVAALEDYVNLKNEDGTPTIPEFQGILELLGVQDVSRPISDIRQQHGYQRGMLTALFRMATRLVNKESHRSWKLPQGIDEAIQAVDDEMPDIFQPQQDGTRVVDRYFLLVKDAFMRVLGKTLPSHYIARDITVEQRQPEAAREGLNVGI